MHARTLLTGLVASYSLSLAACGPEAANGEAAPDRPAGTAVVIRDTVLEGFFEAAGTAEPIEQATLSTRLMGQVLEVAVREGDRVTAGALLLRIDARDLDARRRQVEAQLAQASAAQHEAGLMALRMRALFADSAAPRAQLDAAEAALARADAGVAQAQAAAAEVDAMGSYAEIRAPFAGIVTRRFVDPGAFAAPGAPLVTVQNPGRLRITAAAAPDAVGTLRRGAVLEATIEGSTVRAVVEGVVPSPGGQTYTVNAVADNPGGSFLPGSAATLLIPAARRPGLVIPAAAVRRDGDLAGVRLLAGGRAEIRWVRLGRRIGEGFEVLAGLAAGDSVLVPTPAGEAR